MPLTTEVFVLAVFIIGCPFFYFMLRDSDLPGSPWFMLAYLFLTLSNIFTVAEELWLKSLFNICEHLSITLGSIMIFVAVLKMTATNRPGRIARTSDEVKD